jgi:hypothetical protein
LPQDQNRDETTICDYRDNSILSLVGQGPLARDIDDAIDDWEELGID